MTRTEMTIRTTIGHFTVSTVRDGMLFSTAVFDDRIVGAAGMVEEPVFSATIEDAAKDHQDARVRTWERVKVERERAEVEFERETLVEMGGSNWTTETAQRIDSQRRS